MCFMFSHLIYISIYILKLCARAGIRNAFVENYWDFDDWMDDYGYFIRISILGPFFEISNVLERTTDYKLVYETWKVPFLCIL